MTKEENFDDDWPKVLDNMTEWIDKQVITSGGVERIEIVVSGSLLLAAKREGKKLASHFKKFRRTLEQRFAGRIDFRGDETLQEHRIVIVLEDPR